MVSFKDEGKKDTEPDTEAQALDQFPIGTDDFDSGSGGRLSLTPAPTAVKSVHARFTSGEVEQKMWEGEGTKDFMDVEAGSATSKPVSALRPKNGGSVYNVNDGPKQRASGRSSAMRGRRSVAITENTHGDGLLGRVKHRASVATARASQKTGRNSLAGSFFIHNPLTKSLLGIKDVDDGRIRILALCGRQSNKEVTKLQLENLHITEDKYKITYAHGPIVEEAGDPDVTGLVNGPFYSWFRTDEADPLYKPSVLYAISHLMREIQRSGPFDVIYGFSQGASLATLLSAAYLDSNIKRCVLSEFNGIRWGQHGEVLEAVQTNHTDDRMQLLSEATDNRASKKGTFRQSFANTVRGSIAATSGLNDQMFEHEPCHYLVLACPAGITDKMFEAIGIAKEELEPESIDMPSMFLLGTEDKLRQRGEEMLTYFNNPQMRYMISGHGVPRHIESDKDTMHMLHGGIDFLYNEVSMKFAEPVPVSDVSSISPMYGYQVAGVTLDNMMEEATIPKMLEAQDASKPFMYNARESDSSNFLAYGDLLSFIRGGAGDLRRLGVKEGEVVAYGGPGNGGAVAAVAFLSIASQVTAAPIAPSATEDDASYLLEKYDAKHLILFEGVDYAGLDAIAAKMLASGKMKVHRAKVRADGKPGIFDFVERENVAIDGLWTPESSASGALVNPSDGIGLLLSTSGTTSKPKGVPVKHGALVNNGEIIGSNLRLTPDDTCYSVMPLFHIGGIAASIMCTMAMGSSVCCDGEGYNPERMVDALTLSNPQPTWYSSVPTIHNTTVGFIKAMAEVSDTLQGYGISKEGIWKKGHSLRFIRSGAAALLAPDAIALTMTYGDIPIIPTYSMSEQMPISHPPAGKTDMITTKPGSVGVPVAASIAIVNPVTFKVMRYGEEGEIAISGPTIIDSYLNNKVADAKTYFGLTLPVEENSPFTHGRYFLTGDVGLLDKEGFLVLKGRNKEMIKKGGEQITPMEVEEPLLDHPWVKLVVCFSVPSRIYGEEVGCAVVLSDHAPKDADEKTVVKELKEFLRLEGLAPLKWPTKWILVEESELPKTKSKKFIRVGLAKVLGLEEPEEDAVCPLNAAVPKNTFIDWDTISGFRFLLSCYVMFMHIGSNKSWGAFSSLRGWPWHVHVFFTLGGWSMAAPMNPDIKKKFKYFMARMGSMYPMYVVALIFTLINLLVTCRPSTFKSDFTWHSKPDDLYIDGVKGNGVSPLFCEGTPATPNSYWGSLFLTIFVYLVGAPITPFWLLNWWMGYYFWFSAMYYQCLMVFPMMYNSLLKMRGNTRKYFMLLISLLVLNAAFLAITWFSVKDKAGYNVYDEKTGEKKGVEDYNKDAFVDNAIVLGWYLFSPFWMLYFVIGACAAFLYDAYRPAEKSSGRWWGFIADMCTLAVIVWSICLVAQGNIGYVLDKDFDLRPAEADNFTDTSAVNRIWDNICGRLFAPLTTLWIFSLSTGRGVTASILRMPFLVDTIAPHSYNCFLFHQMVGQWYYAATREGHWWNWWRYRKAMYWFSPQPCPVEWYEYFYVVGLTVAFSALMNNTAQPLMSVLMEFFNVLIFGENELEVDMEEALLEAIEDMTGFAPEMDWGLDQCGLSSVGLPLLAARLSKAFSTKTAPLNITTASLSHARTVQDLVGVVEEIRQKSDEEGI